MSFKISITEILYLYFIIFTFPPWFLYLKNNFHFNHQNAEYAIKLKKYDTRFKINLLEKN